MHVVERSTIHNAIRNTIQNELSPEKFYLLAFASLRYTQKFLENIGQSQLSKDIDIAMLV